MIVLTTPTGNIGRQLLNKLLDHGAPVRVIVRDAAKLSADVRGRIEVVEGSHGEPAVIERALTGATSLFWLPPPDFQAPDMHAYYQDFARPAAEAVRRLGVPRVVGVSALGRGTPWSERAGFVTASLRMDDQFMGTGVHYRSLAMPSFMDNLLRQVGPIKSQGMFFGPIDADRKAPTCATGDIAAVAARWLLDDTWTGQETVPVLGPEDLSFNDIAGIVSETLGKPVRYQQIPFAAFRENIAKTGMSPSFVDGYYEMMTAKNEGLDNAQERTSEGTTPTTFRQWCAQVLKPAVEG